MISINNYEIEYHNITILLDLEINVTSWWNDGIGEYEYWGSKEFDKGRDYIEDFSIVNLKINNKLISDLNIIKDIYEILRNDKKFFELLEKEDKKENETI